MPQQGAQKESLRSDRYGQLDWKLRNDPRVVVMERVNVRYLDPHTVPERFDLITVDVSFISLKLIPPVATESSQRWRGLPLPGETSV